MLVGAFSPITKMLCPWHSKEVIDKEGNKFQKVMTVADLQDNHEDVFSEHKFSFLVPRSSGDIKLTFNQPRFFKDPDVVEWLTGGPTGEHKAETNWTGCVQLDVSPEVMGEMMAAIASGERPDKDIQVELERATKKAKEIAATRVMKQVRAVWKNYLSQVELNKEQNLGTPNFSPVEYLCSKVLNQELTSLRDREEKRRKEMESIASGLLSGQETFGPRT
jgi:hypothetical protein